MAVSSVVPVYFYLTLPTLPTNFEFTDFYFYRGKKLMFTDFYVYIFVRFPKFYRFYRLLPTFTLPIFLPTFYFTDFYLTEFFFLNFTDFYLPSSKNVYRDNTAHGVRGP